MATAIAFDDEMKSRIKNHKASRPKEWRTLEASANVGRKIKEEIGDADVVIIDCITVLVNNILLNMMSECSDEPSPKELLESTICEIESVISCIKETKADYIIVTNEVGLGIVPDNQLSRSYRDALGKANQMLAEAADKVLFIVCGIPMQIKPAK